MSNRTPGLQARSQYHSYWGQYAWAAGGNDPGAANLPNDTANPQGLPYVGVGGQLEIGDTASTTDALAANRGLWVCIDPGTAGGADAVWRRLDNGTAVTQTIRDAHVIVVAQSGTLAPLFGATPPPANQLNLAAVTGDVASVTCDFLDTGNGAQFALALLAALAALPATIDVRLRPCTLDLDLVGAPAVPLTVPAGCRLVGGGRTISKILSKKTAAASQEVFILAVGSSMVDLRVESPAQASPLVTASFAVVRTTGANVRVKDCDISMSGLTRTQPWALWDSTATIDVSGCRFEGANQTDPATKSIGVVLGDPTVANSFQGQPFDYQISHCLFTSINRMIFSYNVLGGSVQDCEGQVVRPTGGAILMLFAGAPLDNAAYAARLDNIRIDVDGNEVALDPNYVGVQLTNVIDNFILRSVVWSAIQVSFAPLETPTIRRVGFQISTAADGAQIVGGTLASLLATEHASGVRISAAGATVASLISDIMLTGCLMKNPVIIAAVAAIGFDIFTTTFGQTEAISIANCNARNAPAGGFGVRIFGAASTNTIVLGNNLVPAPAGTAVLDLGTTTEIAHNILA